MEFTLVYRGQLAAERVGQRDEKQRLRRIFHQQFAVLWKEPPLDALQQLWNKELQHYQPADDITSTVGGFIYAPLCNEKYGTVADLEIDMLRPERPGSFRKSAGDIDNRLKVLLDSLRMPRYKGELPDMDVPGKDESPFFCLLEDDALIHDISVRSHRWLERNADPGEVLLIMRIRILLTRDNFFGSNFGSWMV